ncbi:MAG: hypothetical protein AB1473_23990 [Thermodesulfobacteriota bacterium]
MRTKIAFLTILVISAIVLAGVLVSSAQGRNRWQPAIDQSLTGFVEQGAWYFLCYSPEFKQRIAPYYKTYGPPPPQCCPPPPPCMTVPPRSQRNRGSNSNSPIQPPVSQ